MPSTDYGKFQNFCRDSGNLFATIPVCNLFLESQTREGSSFAGTAGNGFAEPGHSGTCDLRGISLSGGRELANLGSILLCGIGVLVAAGLIFLSNRKKAAVGRREMQLFLLGFIIVEICAIFSIGGFPLNGGVRRAFSAVHIAAVVATAWILMINGVVGFQLVEDGTLLSVGLLTISTAMLFIGTGYIALDTGFSWTGYWDDTLSPPNQAYALYTLYQLVPLLFIVIFFILESYLVLRVLGETKPMLWLLSAALLFAIGQVFQYVISVHICNGTNGKINGGMFETLFSLLAVVMVWVFWSSITEDDWPMPGGIFDRSNADNASSDSDWDGSRSVRARSPAAVAFGDFMLAAVCCKRILAAQEMSGAMGGISS